MRFLILFLFLSNAHATLPAGGLNADAYKLLESPYDEGKLESLKSYGFDHVNLVKNKDGALILENYNSKSGHLTASIKRNADSGKVLNITVNIKSPRGLTREFWDILNQNFVSCPAGTKSGCKKTVIKQCEAQDAKYDSSLADICPFLAEVISIPKTEGPSATSSNTPAPKPSPSPHMRLIFRPH